MNKIKFNLLNKNITRDLDNPRTISKDQFWEYYLAFWLLSNGIHLKASEKELLLFLLQHNPFKNWFLKRNLKDTQKAMGIDITYNDLRYRLSSLFKSGFLIKEGRGDYLLHPRLRDFQKNMIKLFNNDTLVEFTFPFKVSN